MNKEYIDKYLRQTYVAFKDFDTIMEHITFSNIEIDEIMSEDMQQLEQKMKRKLTDTERRMYTIGFLNAVSCHHKKVAQLLRYAV